ncbi:unnamed protein product [Prunus armeniaca]|uniref:Uncharacterized protein n=1 Tax=Prunus armeniaca TaxID=36596 RepID=A0A6J5Y655_PRUAR|nr:unnamed protein product [Prunus armeniaca]
MLCIGSICDHFRSGGRDGFRSGAMVVLVEREGVVVVVGLVAAWGLWVDGP